MTWLNEMSDPVKGTADLAAAFVTVGTLLDRLPAIAALFTIVWTGLRIWEWFKNRK